MSRLVLIPFHSTPRELQLEGPARDSADENVDSAVEKACECATMILHMGDVLVGAYDDEFACVIAKIRENFCKVNTRMHRAYAWLTFATLKVGMGMHKTGNRAYAAFATLTLTLPYFKAQTLKYTWVEYVLT